MATMTVSITQGLRQGIATLVVKSPFNPAFSPAASRLGGRWEPDAKTWTFDPRDEAAVRALCRELYGSDGSAPVAGVSVRIAGILLKSGDASYSFGGRQVAYARGRDSGARLSEGVVTETGRFGSGGSTKNFTCTRSPDLVVILRDLPEEHAREALDKALAAHAAAHDAQVNDWQRALERARTGLPAAREALRVAEAGTQAEAEARYRVADLERYAAFPDPGPYTPPVGEIIIEPALSTFAAAQASCEPSPLERIWTEIGAQSEFDRVELRNRLLAE